MSHTASTAPSAAPAANHDEDQDSGPSTKSTKVLNVQNWPDWNTWMQGKLLRAQVYHTITKPKASAIHELNDNTEAILQYDKETQKAIGYLMEFSNEPCRELIISAGGCPHTAWQALKATYLGSSTFLPVELLRKLVLTPLDVTTAHPQTDIFEWVTLKKTAFKRLIETNTTINELLPAFLMFGWPKRPEFDTLRAILDRSTELKETDVTTGLISIGKKIASDVKTVEAMTPSEALYSDHAAGTRMVNDLQALLSKFSAFNADTEGKRPPRDLRREDRGTKRPRRPRTKCTYCGVEHPGECWHDPTSPGYRPNHPAVMARTEQLPKSHTSTSARPGSGGSSFFG